VEPPLSGLIGLFILIIVSAFFSIVLLAFTNASRQTLREQAERGDKKAQVAIKLIEDPARILSTFRLGNTIVRFLIAGLVTASIVPVASALLRPQFASLRLDSNFFVFIVVLPLAALLTSLLTDILPEAIVQDNATPWAANIARLTRNIIGLLRPVVRLMGALRKLMIGAEHNTLVTEEEIMTLVDAGQEEGSIEQQEKEMIYSIFQLDETLAREIMVPRIDVIAVSINTPLEEARDVIIKGGHSRIPVYEDSLDNIKGLLYAKDLISLWHSGERDISLREILRPPLFVPESKTASELLRELQSAQVHMAIVIDEYGGTAGIVTIEDIVEEIVGEIVDEYDEEEEALYEQVGNDEYMLDGRIDLDDLNRLLDRHLSKELGDTLGGFIYGQLGRVPDEGDEVEADNLHITILSVIDRRIRKVHVRLLQPIEEGEEEETRENHHESQDNGRTNGKDEKQSSGRKV